MPCSDKKPVRSYLTAEEHDYLVRMAGRAGLSVSQFIRQVCLGNTVRSFEHEEFRLELLKTRSDLGRIGGLLKLALTSQNNRPDIDSNDCKKLLAEISLCQQSLKEAVNRL
jgi:hypothetical protein